MVGGKANDSTGSMRESRTKQGFAFGYSAPFAGYQRGKVIVENKHLFVIGITHAASAFIARAQITIGVMLGPNGIVGRILLSLPRTLGPMRGNQNPFVFQRIKAAVGLLTQRHWAVSNQSGDARC